ncbi:MAG TPA: prepilin peptidase [Propionicimonas sp.]|jgi:leader peptidase (prepilin peptidase)/N-methyltransferase|uniref:prepilin peptidase n=1 Tax=Propionicimonas sp. TaxID=1955623 RepID=UPI002F3F837C
MTALVVVFAGLFGLAFGSFANVVAYRVPAGVSLLRPSSCPSCAAPVRSWQNIPLLSWLLLRGRCARCAAPISRRYPVVEAANGIAFAGLAWFVPAALGLSGVPGGLVWAAFAWFAIASSVLVLIDLDTRRLPDVIVLPSYVAGLVLLALACVFGADWWALLRATAGMAAMYAAYGLIRLFRPDGMGGGDVKLAGVAGLYLGWLGWGPLAVGWLAAFLLGGGFAVALIARGRATRGSAVAFGPWLLAGTWVGIFFGNWVWSAYTALGTTILTKG